MAYDQIIAVWQAMVVPLSLLLAVCIFSAIYQRRK